MKLHNGLNVSCALLVLAANIGLDSCAPRPPVGAALPPNPLPPGQTAYAEPPASPTRNRGPAPPPLQPADASTTITGTVRNLNYGPGGFDGLILDQGTIIHFPPEYGNQVNAMAAAGTLVVATGWSHMGPAGDTIFDATTITNRRTNAAITLPAGPPFVALAGTTTTGVVRSFNYGPDGQVNGLILNNGTLVYFPPEYSAQVIRLIPVRVRVRVTGSARPGPTGNQLIDAEIITNRQSGLSVAIANQSAPLPQP